MKYVALEGIDGSGKDVQARLLEQAWRAEGRVVANGREPTRGAVGGLLREKLATGDHPRSHALLFVADRIAAEDGRRVLLESGAWLVQVRSFLSTLVYQQEQWLLPELESMHAGVRLWPDLVVVLDVPTMEAMGRITARGGPRECYEGALLLTAARSAYLGYVEAGTALGVRVVGVDGTGTPEEVSARVREVTG